MDVTQHQMTHLRGSLTSGRCVNLSLQKFPSQQQKKTWGLSSVATHSCLRGRENDNKVNLKMSPRVCLTLECRFESVGEAESEMTWCYKLFEQDPNVLGFVRVEHVCFRAESCRDTQRFSNWILSAASSSETRGFTSAQKLIYQVNMWNTLWTEIPPLCAASGCVHSHQHSTVGFLLSSHQTVLVCFTCFTITNCSSVTE